MEDFDLLIEWEYGDKCTFKENIEHDEKVKLLGIIQKLEEQEYYAGIMTMSKKYNLILLFEDGKCYIKLKDNATK